MNPTSNISVVNGDVLSSYTNTGPNEVRRLQDERLQLFMGNDESPSPMMAHMTTSSKESVAKHKKKMSKKVKKIMSKVHK